MIDFKLQAELQSRMGHAPAGPARPGHRDRDADYLRSGSQPEMWWSAEVHRRLTYPEWQSALPRMVRRWNDDCGHQLEWARDRDDDALSVD
jgi:hypothetical protein